MTIQGLADVDNMRSATSLACSSASRATIGPDNVETVNKLFVGAAPDAGHPPPPTRARQFHRLPGDIYRTLHRQSKNKGTGANADSIDIFIALAKLNIAKLNDDIRRLFELVYNNRIPPAIAYFFSDGFLFCLY